MKKQRGFSLIELLIVIAVVGILAAVAYPSYEAYIIRGNRSAAQQLMLKIASREEQYRLDAKAYTATIGTGGLNVVEDGWTCAATCTNGRYTVSVALVAGPPAGYTISAAAIGRQATGPGGDTSNLTLNDQGAKTPADKWKK
jgi:type IV pilus assembly protein PilE